MKSTVTQIRQRFDNDVERFSNLETGQTSTIDAAFAMNLIGQTAAVTNSNATHFLDIGCGAGNYTLTILKSLPNLNVTLVDLSLPMLNRAVERISNVTSGTITPLQNDMRDLTFEPETFDIIVAASTLHHLRTDGEWHAVFSQFYNALKPGGSFWIFDLIEQSTPAIQSLMWQKYGDYLTHFKDEAYRDHVFNYIAEEDTPRPLMFQLDLLRKVGFQQVEVLHKNGCFAAFGGIK
jgi:tRNA (cmo5U34)-methyltransferase